MRPFNKQDLTHLENLIRALKKAKFEVEGMEVLALADVYKWVSSLHVEIAEEIKKQDVPLAAAVVEQKNTLNEPKKESKKKV